jgi:hypothetical protein
VHGNWHKSQIGVKDLQRFKLFRARVHVAIPMMNNVMFTPSQPLSPIHIHLKLSCTSLIFSTLNAPQTVINHSCCTIILHADNKKVLISIELPCFVRSSLVSTVALSAIYLI